MRRPSALPPRSSREAAESEARARWMSVLAQAPPAELAAVLDDVIDRPAYRLLRRPETGLVMVRGRAGGTGMQFNLGEMPVTRCSVRARRRNRRACVCGRARTTRMPRWRPAGRAAPGREAAAAPRVRADRAARRPPGSPPADPGGTGRRDQGRVLHDGSRGGVSMYSGLADPVLDSQRVFRAVMNAMAHPGRVSTVPRRERTRAASIAHRGGGLTLLDFETPLWLERRRARPRPSTCAFTAAAPVIEARASALRLDRRPPGDGGLGSVRRGHGRVPGPVGDPHRPGGSVSRLDQAGASRGPGIAGGFSSRWAACRDRSGTRSGATTRSFPAGSTSS